MTTYHIAWNEARTVGVICEDHQLAYELRKGASNSLGIVTGPFVEAWAEMTVDDNCTIQTVEIPEMKNYTVQELDDLRRVIENKVIFGTYSVKFENGMRISRAYNESDKDKFVEERTRTHMLAGHTAQDLIESE